MSSGPQKLVDPVVLDCTFRDGGYYTDWHFDDALLKEYLAAISRSRVNVIEAGYLAPTASTCGRFKVDRLDKFDFLPRLPGRRWCAMIDSKAFLGLPDWRSRVRTALGDPRDGVVELVRIASRYDDLAGVEELVQLVADQGYRAALNLMQVDAAVPAQLDQVAATVSRAGHLEAVYVADSFGSMTPGRVTELVERLRAAMDAPVGFHAHDNQGLALLNAMAAIDAGATWIDATVAGMGRGAGNVATEQLCTLLATGQDDVFDALLARHFSTLKVRHGWGGNVLYRIAAQRRLHPMYVQALPQRDMGELADVVRSIPSKSAGAFDRQVLEEVLHGH